MEKHNVGKRSCKMGRKNGNLFKNNLDIRTIYIFPYLNLNIETPPTNIIKQANCNHVISYDLCESVFKQLLIKKKSKCECCSLPYEHLLTLHLVFKNEIIGKTLTRKFDKFELLCVYCHRVKHLLNIIETNSDFSMDLKWLKSANNFNNSNVVTYFKEINRANAVIKSFKYQSKQNLDLYELFRNEEFLNNYDDEIIFLLDRENDVNHPQFQIACYYLYEVNALSESEKTFQEILLKDRENRKRIFVEKEGIERNRHEYELVVDFIWQIRKLFTDIFILEYEWEVKESGKIVGVGDLVMTDLTDFYVCEIKYLNGKNNNKKLKKLEEQTQRYTKMFNDKKADSCYYGSSFINQFSMSKIYGISFTNEDSEIKCSYSINDSFEKNYQEDSTTFSSLHENESDSFESHFYSEIY